MGGNGLARAAAAGDRDEFLHRTVLILLGALQKMKLGGDWWEGLSIKNKNNLSPQEPLD